VEQSFYSALRRRFVKFEQWGKGVARVWERGDSPVSLSCVQRWRHPAFGFEAIVLSMDMLRLFEEECAKTPSPGSAMLTSVFAA